MVNCLELSNILQPDSLTLREAVESLGGYQQTDVPWQIWLFENPNSPIALPGAIRATAQASANALFNHDCLHVLLGRGFSNNDEAFIIGFTMENDLQTQWYHLVIFKCLSSIFYPKKYRFTLAQIQLFDLGCKLGRNHAIKNFNRFNFKLYEDKTIGDLRHLLYIS